MPGLQFSKYVKNESFLRSKSPLISFSDFLIYYSFAGLTIAFHLQIGAKNGRLSIGCTGGHKSTTQSTQPSQAAGSKQSAGQSSEVQASSVPANVQSTSSSAAPSAGAVFTGAASSVQPAVGFLAAVIGVMALL